MTDQTIRPENGLMLFALQSAEDVPAVPNGLTDAIPVEIDSVSWDSPVKMEASNETSGSMVSASPLVVGQPSTMTFKSRVKGAGAGVTYSSTVKPPLHAPLQACGMRGLFTAAIVAAALTAGTATSATLGAGYVATAQAYRGMPLLLAGTAAGHAPLITDYTAGRVATLSDGFTPALDVNSSAGLPANWTYAGTSPIDGAARLTDQPSGTIYWYEDGRLHRWINCRGTVDFDGNSARPGFATFNFTGVYLGDGTDAAVPAAIIANHSAPLLVQGTGVPPAILINRRGLPISKWSLMNGGTIESPDDPNTATGFGSGQIVGRTPMLEVDPLMTLVAARNALAEIRAFSQYPAVLRFGTVAGNRLSILTPVVQPVEQTAAMRGKLRSETVRYQALPTVKDAVGRDGDRILCFY